MKPIIAPFKERENEILELARSNKISPASALRLYQRLESELMVRSMIRALVFEMEKGEVKYLKN